MRKSIIIAAAVACLSVPTVASASPMQAEPFEKSVEHDDLDLSTSEGASRLEDRVRSRINQLCRTQGRDAQAHRMERECREAAFAATVPQVRMAIAEANSDRRRLAAGPARSSADRAATPGA